MAALLCGAALSWFASAYPDGLEWSVAGVTGSEETSLAEPSAIHRNLESVQTATAIMPDYALPAAEETVPDTEPASLVNPETSLAGILGSAIIAALILPGRIPLRQKTARRPPPLIPPCPSSRTPRGNSAKWTGFPAGNHRIPPSGRPHQDRSLHRLPNLRPLLAAAGNHGAAPLLPVPRVRHPHGGAPPRLPAETDPVAPARRRHDRDIQSLVDRTPAGEWFGIPVTRGMISFISIILRCMLTILAAFTLLASTGFARCAAASGSSACRAS